MKRAILTSLLIISFTLIYSQGHDIIWENSFGGTEWEASISSCLASDGGYIIAGQTTSNDGDVTGNHGKMDAWIIKLDVLGNLLWQKCIGTDTSEYLYSISNTNDGGYIAAGLSDSDTFRENMWLVKLDFEGNIDWERSLGGTGDDRGKHAIQTNDGGYICIGNNWSVDGDVIGNHGKRDYWVVKLNNNGILEWQKSLGGSSNDLGEYILELEDGNFLIAGGTSSVDGDVSFNNGGYAAWIVKIDPIGNIIWERSYGGSSTDYASQIIPSTDGGYTIGGRSYTTEGDATNGHGLFDTWIFEIDELGNLLWENWYGGTGSDDFISLHKTQDNGNIVVSYTNSNDEDVFGNHGAHDCWIIKTDHLGILEWQQCYGGSSTDKCNSVFRNENGNYIIAGGSESDDGDVSENLGSRDFWVFEIGEQESAPPLIPIRSAGIIITVLLIVGAIVIRRVG